MLTIQQQLKGGSQNFIESILDALSSSSSRCNTVTYKHLIFVRSSETYWGLGQDILWYYVYNCGEYNQTCYNA